MIPQNNEPPIDDAAIRAAICDAGSIAVVGASNKPDRPVYGVMRYLIAAGFTVHPVNPFLAGEDLLGRRVYATLAEISETVDMVDIFRRADELSSVVDEALSLSVLPRVIWMQLGLRDEDAAARARARGVKVIMDRCTKIEHGRLCT